MTKCFNIVSNVNIRAGKDENTEQSTWQPWKESRVAWGCGERVGWPQGGEICWRSKVGVGEVGELGPRKEGWRRVGHLTGGGHPLSQSTSVTVAPRTPPRCTTHSVSPKQGLGGNWFSALVSLSSCWQRVGTLTGQVVPPAKHLRAAAATWNHSSATPSSKSWKGSFAEEKSALTSEGFWERCSSPKLKFRFFEFCHLDSGDQLVAAGGDLPPAFFLPR